MPTEHGPAFTHFDRAILQNSMQLIINHQVHDADVGLLRQFMQDRPHLSFLNALLMPSRYGSMEWTKEEQDRFFAHSGLMQLSVLFDIREVPSRSLLYPMRHAYNSKKTNRPDPVIDSPIRKDLEDDLAGIMAQEQQTIVLHDELSRQMFLRLGLDEHSQVAETLGGHIRDFLADRLAGNDPAAIEEALRRYDTVFDFARRVYNLTDKPTRKTGEYYYQHPIRVAWYLLSYLEHEGKLPTDPNELMELIECTFLHDGGEDLGAREDDAREGKFRVFSRPRLDVRPKETVRDQIQRDLHDDYLPYGLEDWEMVLVNQDDQEISTQPISRGQRTTLRALTARNAQTYLHQSMHEDPSGRAALIKMFDRLDNLLTYPPDTTWQKLMGKVIESFTSMGQVTLHARYGQNRTEKIGDMLRCMQQGRFVQLLPLNVLSYSLFLQIASHVQANFREHQAQYTHPVTGKHKNIRNWKNYQRMRHLQGQYGGIMLEDLPSHLNLNSLSMDHAARCRSYPTGPEAEAVPAYRYLLSYSDIASYLKRVEERCIESQPLILNHTGCPEILFMRKGMRRWRGPNFFERLFIEAENQ